MQEVDNIAKDVIGHLQSINSLEDAKNFLASVIYDVRGTEKIREMCIDNDFLANVEKNDQAIIKKLQEEKQILVKAFNKQRQKSQVKLEKYLPLPNSF